MYTPNLGRWLTVDPLSYEAGDSNLYGYIWNNPTCNLDPYGLFAITPVFPDKIWPSKDNPYLPFDCKCVDLDTLLSLYNRIIDTILPRLEKQMVEVQKRYLKNLAHIAQLEAQILPLAMREINLAQRVDPSLGLSPVQRVELLHLRIRKSEAEDTSRFLINNYMWTYQEYLRYRTRAEEIADCIGPLEFKRPLPDRFEPNDHLIQEGFRRKDK